jgi:hypothetical protein
MRVSTESDSKYWLIRHPGADGTVVARFATAPTWFIPDPVGEYEQFHIKSVPDRKTATATTIDQSGLTDSEKQRLSQVFPIIDAQTGGTT